MSNLSARGGTAEGEIKIASFSATVLSSWFYKISTKLHRIQDRELSYLTLSGILADPQCQSYGTRLTRECGGIQAGSRLIALLCGKGAGQIKHTSLL